MHPLDANETEGRDAPSWYAATAHSRPPADPLDGDVRADICIVGGGYAGLSAALHCAEAGLDVRLVETHRVGWGASGRNGGQIGSGQRLETSELESLYGFDDAKKLWDLGEESKALVYALIERFAIDCDLAKGVLHADHRARFAPHTRAAVETLQQRYDYPDCAYLSPEALSERLGARGYHGGMADFGAGHCHPLNFALGLAWAAQGAGAALHERTRALRIEPGAPARLVTDRGTITADHVILAGNGYLNGLEPTVARHVLPINNFIIATEPLGAERARALIRYNEAVADSRFVVNYYRLSPDHRMLFGGGESYGMRFPSDITAVARPRMLSVFPGLADARIDYAWGGTLGITMSRLPHVARPAQGVLSAGGFSGHGVALATMAGKILADAARSETERFDIYARHAPGAFPGGARFAQPLLTLAMIWFSLRDRI